MRIQIHICQESNITERRRQNPKHKSVSILRNLQNKEEKSIHIGSIQPRAVHPLPNAKRYQSSAISSSMFLLFMKSVTWFLHGGEEEDRKNKEIKLTILLIGVLLVSRSGLTEENAVEMFHHYSVCLSSSFLM